MLNAYDSDRFIARYVANRLGGSPMLPAGEIKIVLPLNHWSLVSRCVEVDSQPAAFLYLYGSDQSADADARKQADALVRNHDLFAPLLLDMYECPQTGIIGLLEQHIPGESSKTASLDEERIRALADTILGFHAITNARNGTLGALTSGSFVRHIHRQVHNRYRSIRRWAPPAITGHSRRAALHWLDVCAEGFRRLDTYHLIHDKPTRENWLWHSGERRFYLLDPTALAYGCRWKDLAQIYYDVLGAEPECIACFDARYFGDPRGGDRNEAAYFLSFHQAYYHLSQCAVLCRRIVHDRAGAGAADQAVEHWQHLSRIVSEHFVR
jgi:hypothetical protein